MGHVVEQANGTAEAVNSDNYQGIASQILSDSRSQSDESI